MGNEALWHHFSSSVKTGKGNLLLQSLFLADSEAEAPQSRVRLGFSWETSVSFSGSAGR